MEPMDLTDLSRIGPWTIKSWKPDNSIEESPLFPTEGFALESPLVIMRAGDKGVNLFWADQSDMPCSVHFPDAPESLSQVTFAGDSFPCRIGEPKLIRVIPVNPPGLEYLQLTVILSTDSKRHKGGTGNTGTFVAQSPPGGLLHGEPGHEKPGK